MQERTWTLDKDRPKTSVTIEMPVDVVEKLKQVAASRDMEGLHELVRYYIGKGLKEDLDQPWMEERTERNDLDSTQLGAIP